MEETITHQCSVRFGIVAANNTGYVEAMLSCIEAGNIAVPLRSTDDQYRINAANIAKIVTPTDDGVWMRRKFTPANTSEIALIAFTSGTEGNPKGVILMHKNLAEVVARLNSLMQLDDSISEYIGVPVYHSFGFGRCRAVATAGGKFFIPSNGFNPSEIAEMLKKGEINAISAVPSLWRVLLANKDVIGNYGKKVRWIEIGSQYMSRQEKEQMKVLFPEARIVQHYGLTEASRTTLLPIHELEGDLLESVGQALGSVEVKLTSEGQIAIRGDHVAQSYLIDGKEISLGDEDGWFVTKDLGNLENGYLYYQGRADDVINCGGLKVYPETLETKVYASIGRSGGLAICRKKDPMRGEGFLVAVTKELNVDRQLLREAVLQATQELGVNAGNAITIVDVESLPKTATGKIQRKQLAEWYAKEFLPEEQHQPKDVSDASLGDVSPIQAGFCRTLNIKKVQPEDTFISLGGDSLSYVQLSMEIERYLGYLPGKWEQMSLHELERLVPQRKKITIIETNILLRALAISGVVANHSGFHFIEGGAKLLLLIASLNFARFQGNSLIQGHLKTILPLLKNILVPYYVVVIGYQLWKRKLNLGSLLLFSNFQDIQTQTTQNIFFVWFVANLVQCILILTLAFSFPGVRKFASVSPWRFGIVSLGIGIATHIIGPYVWVTTYLSDQVPHMLFWLFSLGWCIHFAKTRTEKIVTTVIMSIVTPLFFGINSLENWWILIGGILLLWQSYIPIPKLIKFPIQMISAATYYIYLTAMIFIAIMHKSIGMNYPLVTMGVTLLGCVLTWSAVQSLKQFLPQKAAKNLDYTDPI